MATLYLDRAGLELRREGGALALYDAGTRVRTVPIVLLERIVLQGDTLLGSGLIGHLGEAGVELVVLSRRHARRMALVLGPPHGDARIRLAQYRLWHQEDERLAWARRIVAAKVTAQRRLIEQAEEERLDRRRPLVKARRQLASIREQVGEAPDVAALLGLEGAAAAAYFGGLGALFPPALGFKGRNRRPPRDPVNACLSLGYTLLHASAVREAHGAGLDPYVGFFHEPAHGRASLAADLIEPLRPHVDAWTWEMFRTRRLRDGHFRRDKGACLLDKAGRRTFYAAFDGHERALRRLLRRQCRQLVRTLRAGAEAER